MPVIRIKRVDGTKWSSVIEGLHAVCLPGDDHYDTLRGAWWLAFDGTAPVAFGGYVPTRGNPATIFLCRSGVLPEYRGGGIQKRLIRARLRAARRAGHTYAVTYTLNNPASSNSLIAEGFRLYLPAHKWGCPGALYWRRKL